jgi:protein CpxP
MNKFKLLSICCIALLLINLALLTFVLSTKPTPHNGDRNRNIIIEKLQFTKLQIEQYDELIMQHRGQMQQATKELNLKRKDLYILLNYAKNTSKKDSIVADIAKEESNIERINYEHFLAIKVICTPSQLKSFNELTKKMAEMFDKNL